MTKLRVLGRDVAWSDLVRIGYTSCGISVTLIEVQVTMPELHMKVLDEDVSSVPRT